MIHFCHYIYCIIFAYVPKINSIIASFNKNNSNVIKTYLKSINNGKYHTLLIQLFC